MKRDKKILDKEIENQMDREFEKRGIKLNVYYFRDIPAFNAVTVVTAMPYHWEDLEDIILKWQQPQHYLYNHATYLLQKLAGLPDLHGVAICDNRDPFNRHEGRCRAKRRLLRHLKERR